MTRSVVKKRLPYILLAAALLMSVGIMLYKTLAHSGEVIDSVGYRTLNESVKGDAHIFTHCIPVEKDSVSVSVPTVTDGTYVHSGDEISKLYSGEEKSLDIVRDAKEALYIFGASDMGEENFTVSDIDTAISEITQEIHSDREQDRISDVYKKQQRLHMFLNRREIITGKKENYDSEIKHLREKIESITAVSDLNPRTVSAPADGYFFSECDGREILLAPSLLESMTFEQYRKLTDTEYSADSAKYAGKIITENTWYFSLGAEIGKGEKFKENTVYKAITDYGSICLDVTFCKMIPSPDGEECVLIFSCSTVNSDSVFSAVRQIEVVLGEVSGVSVAESAIHFVDGVQGVYAVRDSVLEFVPVKILGTSDGYHVVEPVDGHSLETYDKVVTSGKDLYVGKTVE